MLKPRQLLGKYRIDGRLAAGGFATVYRAFDTVEGIHVALKVPFPHLMTPEAIEDFKREVQITAKLDHPNILGIKNADFIDGIFIIASRLGRGSLDDRLKKRLSFRQQVSYAEQMLDALAYAHERRVIHCDVKPDNFILFDENVLRLSDFGIAKITMRTMSASGSGTLGYVAPEQAMGRPSFRSDCFSVGLILYRMFAGTLPQWPYRWPPPAFDRLRKSLHRDMVDIIRRAIQVEEKRRFDDATQMLAAFRRAKPRTLGARTRQKRRKATNGQGGHDLEGLRHRAFRRAYRGALELHHHCSRCEGPVSEAMVVCPWCGTARKKMKEDTRFPARCKRCRRGLKLDWRFCPWCYGATVGPQSDREYTDRRYEGRCSNAACSRRDLMPFMRYCPWCRTKVRRRWKLEGSSERCSSCGWGVDSDYWSVCPWCTRSLT